MKLGSRCRRLGVCCSTLSCKRQVCQELGSLCCTAGRCSRHKLRRVDACRAACQPALADGPLLVPWGSVSEVGGRHGGVKSDLSSLAAPACDCTGGLTASGNFSKFWVSSSWSTVGWYGGVLLYSASQFTPWKNGCRCKPQQVRYHQAGLSRAAMAMQAPTQPAAPAQSTSPASGVGKLTATDECYPLTAAHAAQRQGKALVLRARRAGLQQASGQCCHGRWAP